jgi:hypothetical protein
MTSFPTVAVRSTSDTPEVTNVTSQAAGIRVCSRLGRPDLLVLFAASRAWPKRWMTVGATPDRMATHDLKDDDERTP